jgi:hypothetical protein
MSPDNLVIMVLISVLGWIGVSVQKRLTELTAEVKQLNSTMVELDRDLRKDITQVAEASRATTFEIATRVMRLEERFDSFDKSRAHSCPYVYTIENITK